MNVNLFEARYKTRVPLFKKYALPYIKVVLIRRIVIIIMDFRRQHNRAMDWFCFH